jgi:hypothetical protein
LLLSDAGCIKWVNYLMTRLTSLLTVIQIVVFPTSRVLDSLRFSCVPFPRFSQKVHVCKLLRDKGGRAPKYTIR